VNRARRLTLVATSLGFAVVQLDVSVVNVAVKSIGASLGGGVSSLQLVVSAYTVAFAALILTAGALADRLGARRMFVAGFVLFTLASVACGLAPDLAVLVGARAIQGVGAGILVPGSLSLLSHTYEEPRARAKAIGLYLAGASVALSGGPLVGGVLISALGWRAIFFINVPIALGGMFLTLGWAAETTRTERRLDLPGQLTAMVALVALVVATIQGGAHGFGDFFVLAAYAVSVLALLTFVWIESRSRSPMLPLRLFNDVRFSAAAAGGFLVNTAFYGLIFVFSLFFQREQQLSPLQTGLALAPAMLGIMASNLGADRLAARWGPARSIAGGAIVLAVACAALLSTDSSTGYAAIVAPLTGLGVGGGIIIPIITAELLASVDRSRAGVAAGTLNTLRQAGSAVGVALFGSLVAGRFVPGFHVALWISVGLVTVTGALAGGLFTRRGVTDGRAAEVPAGQ
jgi:DHA2 family methylenomycin A resistance protein-like MFS transporter